MSDYYLYNRAFPHFRHELSSHFIFLCSLTIIYYFSYINNTFLNSSVFYIFVTIMDRIFFSLYFVTDLLGFVYLFYILCLPYHHLNSSYHNSIFLVINFIYQKHRPMCIRQKLLETQGNSEERKRKNHILF